MKNQIRGWIVLAVFFIIDSVIAFALPFAHTAVFWLSYIFSVIAIAVQVYVMQVAFCKEKSVKSKFYGFPVANVGVIYMLAQLVLGLVFMALAVHGAVRAVPAAGALSRLLLPDEVGGDKDDYGK